MKAAASHSLFVLSTLIEKDFKVRYRNMSLGIFWSLVNPLVMMSVLTFVFSVITPNPQEYFPLFLLMGLLPYNFFTLAWATGTNSIIENSTIVKKVPFPRELLPLSVVLGNALHYLIQLGLLLVAVFVFIGASAHWIWIPVIVGLQILFVSGMALGASALDVYYRDMRYVVESSNLVLFWITPIFYSFDTVSQQYAWLYELNPIAAVILLIRRVLLDAQAPNLSTLVKLVTVSLLTFTVGLIIFRRLKRNFSDYL